MEYLTSVATNLRGSSDPLGVEPICLLLYQSFEETFIACCSLADTLKTWCALRDSNPHSEVIPPLQQDWRPDLQRLMWPSVLSIFRRNAHELVDCMRLEPMSDQECDGAHSIMLLRLLTVHVTFLDNPKQNRNRYTCQLICACTALKAVSGRHSAFPPTSKLGVANRIRTCLVVCFHNG